MLFQFFEWQLQPTRKKFWPGIRATDGVVGAITGFSKNTFNFFLPFSIFKCVQYDKLKCCDSYIDRLSTSIFDSNPRLLNHVQIGPCDHQRGVATEKNKTKQNIFIIMIQLFVMFSQHSEMRHNTAREKVLNVQFSRQVVNMPLNMM